MQLVEFQVKKFRNVVDSTEIKVQEDVTCLVGKNESGKTALLQALYRLNPAYPATFDLDEHYPRWLKVREVKSGEAARTHPIEATFSVQDADKAAEHEILGTNVLQEEQFTIALSYTGSATVSCRVNEAAFVQGILGRAETSDQIAKKLAACKTVDSLTESVAKLRSDLVDDASEKAEVARNFLDTIDTELGRILGTSNLWQKVVSILRERIPTFFYFSDYSLLPGRLDLRELEPAGTDKPGSSSLQTARALLELAGTDVPSLSDENYDVRKAELEAVSNELTSQVFEFWTQNPDLSVDIDVDKETVEDTNGRTAVARCLDVRVKDRRHGYTNNFGQRSSGFQWFFSFLAAFSEFEYLESGVIVLLDEPALALHGKAQADFLRFINERLAARAQVLYTTHSPFMVEMGSLERVRIVEDKGPSQGARATQEVFGTDRDSLFPLQAALGYDIAQTIFVGPDNLVVEGTSDFTYLSVIGDYLSSLGRTGLNARWKMLPVGGASNIPTFVALIGPHLDVTVLVDSGTEGMQRLTNLEKRGLLSGKRLITIGEITGTNNADIEDLFAAEDYLKIFNTAMNKRITVAKLPPGDRIVKRIANHLGEDFDHGIPADHLLRKRDTICPKLSEKTLDRFEQLVKLINRTLA